MTELMGLASMTEIPVVLVDAQRSGPSTGLPTKLEQSDLFHALYGGHGDFPRIVVAPASVEDCLTRTVHAFNLAEKYQMPVILLSDQSLSHRTQTIEIPDVSRLKVANRTQPTDGGNGDGYARYAITDSGVSPAGIPGVFPHPYVAPGLEHDEQGHPDLSAAVHEAMTEKRFRKLATVAKETDTPDWAPRFGHARAELGIIGWGATEGSIHEAVNRCLEKGYKVAAIHPRILNPLPETQLRQFIASVRQVLVPEVNFQGQFAHHLAAQLGVRPIRLNKIGGVPFTPGEIVEKIEEVLHHV
jgi:2-oxoglutarate ferredoxin oxidoreductase subunit alpha